MKKHYVLDTNILIHDPDAIFKFEDNYVYIPGVSIEELDNHKYDSGERGHNVQEVARNLDKLREYGTLMNGVTSENGGKIFTFIPNHEFTDSIILPGGWERDKNDNHILFTVLQLQQNMIDAYRGLVDDSELDDEELAEFEKECREQANLVILVTNDIILRIKADALGINVQKYRNDRVGKNLYTGRSEYYVEDSVIDTIYTTGCISPDNILFIPMNSFSDGSDGQSEDVEFTNNEFVVLHAMGKNSSVLVQYWDGQLRQLVNQGIDPWDIKPRNSGQRFMLEALMEPDVPLVVVNGPAGCGKTLLALASGLQQVVEDHVYKRVLLTRANVLMGEEIGFLPGTEEEKIDPLLRSAYDNLEVLLGNSDDKPEDIQDKIHELFERGYMKAEAVAYLRGRSIADTYIIVDEAQNLTPIQAKSIVSRVGAGSKLILLGDPSQIDRPRLDRYNNGLVYTIERMKGYANVITMIEPECTRSELSKVASMRM